MISPSSSMKTLNPLHLASIFISLMVSLGSGLDSTLYKQKNNIRAQKLDRYN